MVRNSKKTSTVQVLAEKDLSDVSGGATSQPHHDAAGVSASIAMEGLAGSFAPGSAWNLFFAAAAEA